VKVIGQIMNKKEIGERSEIYFHSSQNMSEVESESVALMVTSPPYYNYIEYGEEGIGTETSYQDYLDNIKLVLKESCDKLIPGGTAVINITNMKSRKAVEGESFLYPILADYINLMRELEMVFFDEIVWIKADANNGALKGKPLFGSYPYPPTPKILDSIFENILIFKKQGKLKERVSKENKEKSKLTKDEWMVFTKGLWYLKPDRISGHPASFPIDLPKRIIQLYSFEGESVLDPFAGTGTSVIAADILGRKGIGYEIYEGYEHFIDEKCSIYMQQELFN